MEPNIHFSKHSLPRKTTVRHSSLADKTIQNKRQRERTAGASYSRSCSTRGTQHSRETSYLLQTTASASVHTQHAPRINFVLSL